MSDFKSKSRYEKFYDFLKNNTSAFKNVGKEDEKPSYLEEKIGKKYHFDEQNHKCRIISVATGKYHTVGLRDDGTVVAVGDNYNGQCNVSKWEDIVAIYTGESNTIGIKKDGTAIMTTKDEYSYNVDMPIASVSSKFADTVFLKKDGRVAIVDDFLGSPYTTSHMEDIISVAVGEGHIVGLEESGTVIFANNHRNCYRYNNILWRDISKISVGNDFTVGIKKDGTVVATSFWKHDEFADEFNVSSWTDIVDVASGYNYFVGLKRDGTVVATGENSRGQCDVSAWRDIVAIAIGLEYTVGIKKDGTVVATGYNRFGQCDVSSWTDIEAVSAGYFHLVGLKKDGTIVAVGNNEFGQCKVSVWNYPFGQNG